MMRIQKNEAQSRKRQTQSGLPNKSELTGLLQRGMPLGRPHITKCVYCYRVVVIFEQCAKQVLNVGLVRGSATGWHIS